MLPISSATRRAIVRKHYAKWSPARQVRIDDLIAWVHSGKDWMAGEETKRVQ
jgi:hypothetical protein